MDLQDSQVKGGVFIVHQVRDKKHQYVVDNVVNYKNRRAEKTFVRGDRLMQVNDMDAEDLQPEVLAKILAEGSPKLKVHKTFMMVEDHVQPLPTGETLHPVSKEFTTLTLSMEMKRKETEVEQENGGREEGGFEVDVCPGGYEANGEERDLFIVTMEKTSISVVKGRGCERGVTCPGCHGAGCAINDVIMVSASSTVTHVPGCSYKQDKPQTASIEHRQSERYLRVCCGSLIYASPNPERITIYHYRSNCMDGTFKGIPVVLNFTDTNLFVRCYKDGERTCLQVETCETERLQQISKNDEEALSFVFYMKSDRSGVRTFESVLYSGWFIQIVSTNADFQVTMDTLDSRKDDAPFLFIIRK